jgi:hypothetical protein
MGWQDYATFDPIDPVGKAFPLSFSEGKDVPVDQMPAGMAFGAQPGSGFGSLAQFAPLIAGRFGAMMAGNANTAQSAQNAMGTSIGMFDVNQGVTAANRRQAIFDEMMAPIQAARIKMNPDYRRGQLRDTLRNLNTSYSAFVG